jgi:regulator of protease activity HflC (stomatin/prohibitin superfamily)
MNITSILQGIAALLWLLCVGGVALAVTRAGQRRPIKGIGTVILVLLVGAVGVTILSAGLIFIEPDQRGVIISPYDPKGYRANALGPGLHWIIPGERVQRYSISRQTYTMSVASSEGQVQGDDSIRARTKAGQEVMIDASVIYQIDPNQVVNLHIIWQNRYEAGVVRALARGIIRDAASQYGVEEIVSSKRAEMEGTITDVMAEELRSNSLMLVQFVLRDIHFSEEYASAVEQKQIAEQQAKQAEFVVKQREQEALQAIETAKGQAESVKINAQGAADARLIQAKAEAEALGMIAAALEGNPDLLTYQYITKLSPNVQVMYLPSGQQYLIPLPTPATVTETTPMP